MAHVKAGGTSKNLRDSGPQYRGIKLSDGQKAKAGSIIVRQKGVKVWVGENVKNGQRLHLFLLKRRLSQIYRQKKNKIRRRNQRVKVASVI